SRPRSPRGFTRLCSIPAPKPSTEMENPPTRTFVISLPRLSHRVLFKLRPIVADRVPRCLGARKDMLAWPYGGSTHQRSRAMTIAGVEKLTRDRVFNGATKDIFQSASGYSCLAAHAVRSLLARSASAPSLYNET